MSIQRLLDAVERRGDIGRRVAALVFPISNRPRVTSSCARKIGLCEPGEHTSGPNLASRDDVAHNQTLYTILEKPPRLTRFIESRPGHTLSDGPCRLSCLECWRSLAAVERVLPSSESNVGGRPPAAHPEKMNIPGEAVCEYRRYTAAKESPRRAGALVPI